MVEQCSALEVEEQAPVIHIDAAHHGHAVIADIALGVEETGREFINAHTRPEQGQIVGTAEPEHQLLIRDPGQDEPHVHPALGRTFQSIQHLLTHGQVWRVDINISLGLREDVQIDRLGQRLLVQRAIRVGLHHAILHCGQAGGRKGGVIGLLRAEGVPYIEEHHGKVPDSGALQPDGRILPVAKALLGIDILIRQIHAAGVGHIAINHHDLAVVAVVHHQRDQRHHRVERDAADMRLLHADDKITGQAQQAAKIIVDQPHIHALSGLAAEDLLHAVPHFAGTEDKKFQKDELFRLFQICQQLGIHLLPAGKVVSSGIPPGRIRPKLCHIAAQVPAGDIQRIGLALRLGKLGLMGLFHLLHPLPQILGGGLVAKSQIKRAAQQGQKTDQNDPADLISAVFILAHQIQHDQDAQRLQGTVQPDPPRRERPERPEQPEHL